MASRVSTAKRRSRSTLATKAASKSLPDLRVILERFHEALAIVNVSRVAISANGDLAQEDCALRQGIAALQVVYNELDKAEMKLSGTLTAA
jgi:hypothetical protein